LIVAVNVVSEGADRRRLRAGMAVAG